MPRTKNGIVYLVGDGIQYADIAGSFLIDAMGLDGIGAAGIRIVDNFKKVGVHYIVRIHTNRPIKKPVIIKMRFPLLDTAARASLPTNFPTMTLSAVLYSC